MTLNWLVFSLDCCSLLRWLVFQSADDIHIGAFVVDVAEDTPCPRHREMIGFNRLPLVHPPSRSEFCFYFVSVFVLTSPQRVFFLPTFFDLCRIVGCERPLTLRVRLLHGTRARLATANIISLLR